MLQLQAQQVLVVQHTADIVETLAVDRITGVACFNDELERLFQRGIQLDRIDLRARDHDLLDRGLRKFEDAVDQLLLSLVEDPPFLSLLTLSSRLSARAESRSRPNGFS